MTARGLFIAVLLVARSASAGEPAHPVEGLAVLEDQSGTRTIQDVSAPVSAGQFAPVRDGSPSFGLTRSAYWARFRLPTQPVILEIDYRGLDHITLFVPDGRGGFAATESGDYLPFTSRSLAHRLEAFRLPPAEPGNDLAYLRVASSGPVVFPLVTWTPEGFLAHDQEERLLLGMYYGAMLVMVLYNLLLFAAFRDKNYLAFASFAFSFASAQFIENGLAFELLWPRSPWWENVSFPIAVGVAVFWAVTFARGFLHSADTPALHRLGSLFLGATALLTAAVPAMPYRYALQAVSTAWVLAIGYALVLIGTAVRAGRWRAAGVFVGAWGALIAGSLLAVFDNFHLVTHGFYTYYGAQLGAIVLVVLLSLGLTARINALRRRRDQAVHDSHFDSLTGIANRRRLDEYLQIEWQRAIREQTTLALILVDLDFFHLYNERFGHVRGDQCLQTIAKKLASSVKRPADLVARYGGEEFAVVLPNTGLAGARHVAEEMRAGIEALDIARAPHVMNGVVTASFGVAAVVPAVGNDPALLVLAADEALYDAKSAGRNQVAAAGVIA